MGGGDLGSRLRSAGHSIYLIILELEQINVYKLYDNNQWCK